MTGVLIGAVALALASFACVHASLLVSLFLYPPRYRGLLALALPPLAPYWGWRAGYRRRTYAWAVALALYTVGVAVLGR